MGEKRAVQRVSCFSKCSLLHNGSEYSGVLENISLTGALVTVTPPIPSIIQVGDSCKLYISGSPGPFQNESCSLVARINSPHIGLHLLPSMFDHGDI
jgi:hypothetical protein